MLIHLRGGSAIKSRRQIAADIVALRVHRQSSGHITLITIGLCCASSLGHDRLYRKTWLMFCRDLKQLAGDTVLPQQISTEHHALADAVWVSEPLPPLSAKSDGGGESRPAETGTGDWPCIKQTTPATMPAQAGVAPGPSDPILAARRAGGDCAIINWKAFDESYWARGRQREKTYALERDCRHPSPCRQSGGV